MTRITFPIGSRVRHRASGQVASIERPVHPDQWWVTWRDGGMVRRALYRAHDLERVPLGTAAVDPYRDQTATPPSTFDAFPTAFDASSSSAPDPSPSSSPDPSPDTGGGGFDGGGGDCGGGGASGEW